MCGYYREVILLIMMWNHVGFCGTTIQYHPVLIQFVYGDPNIPIRRNLFIYRDMMVDHDNFPHSVVQDPNQNIQDEYNKTVMDILVSSKYLVLPNKYLDNVAMLCQRSVWDNNGNQEDDNDSEKEENDSN